MALAAPGCRCSDDEAAPAAAANEGADPEGAEMPDPDPDPGEGTEQPEPPKAPKAATPAAPEAAGSLEVVTADALITKLKGSGRKGTL
ncbi:MAG TPA: hypothetical protein VF103_14585, partial [Polyangiaceae bacterium]